MVMKQQAVYVLDSCLAVMSNLICGLFGAPN